MTEFLRSLWRVITFPFRLIFNILAFPFRGLRYMGEFLNQDIPEERPLIDTFSSLATEAKTRASLWGLVDDSATICCVWCWAWRWVWEFPFLSPSRS